MTKKKFLSTKKTTSQNISISPALKEWIRRYVSVNKEKFPDDERFSSISSFYCETMENVLQILEQGKTLDDFEHFIDQDVREIVDKFSFRGIVNIYEISTEMNKYVPVDFQSMMQFLLYLRSYYLKNYDGYNPRAIELMSERIKNYLMENKITHDFDLKLRRGGGAERKLYGTLEFSGHYENLHHANVKFNVLILAIIGVRITKYIYSKQEIYSRIDFESTDLLFHNDVAEQERSALLQENLDWVINFSQVLNDKSPHTWLKAEQKNNCLVSFKSDDNFNEIISDVENDLASYGDPRNKLTKLLRFFEHLHWIRIIGENDLSFYIDLDEEYNRREWELLINFLSQKGELKEERKKYFLIP